MTTAVVKNVISRLVIPFQIIDKFSFLTLHKILEQQKLTGSASKANKDCQILLFDVHDVLKTLKVSFTRRISEGDGEQMVRLLHSSVQLLYLAIKFILLFFAVPIRPLPSSYLKAPTSCKDERYKFVSLGQFSVIIHNVCIQISEQTQL